MTYNKTLRYLSSLKAISLITSLLRALFSKLKARSEGSNAGYVSWRKSGQSIRVHLTEPQTMLFKEMLFKGSSPGFSGEIQVQAWDNDSTIIRINFLIREGCP